VAVTAAEQVERLRTWASGRCLNASAPGVFRRDGEPAPKPRQTHFNRLESQEVAPSSECSSRPACV
jgi:hypothetical protein